MKTNGDDPINPWQEFNQNFCNTAMVPGLTKREYFAALAMQGLCANEKFSDFCNDQVPYIREIHQEAVKQADYLIAELNKKIKGDVG